MWKMWGALDIEFDTLELLVDILEFRVEAGRLVVSQEAQAVPDHIGALCAALSSIWHFRKWTESRWLTVGSSSRIVVAALLYGLEIFVTSLMQDPDVKIGFLEQFHRLKGPCKYFLVKAAIVGRVPEAVLIEKVL